MNENTRIYYTDDLDGMCAAAILFAHEQMWHRRYKHGAIEAFCRPPREDEVKDGTTDTIYLVGTHLLDDAKYPTPTFEMIMRCSEGQFTWFMAEGDTEGLHYARFKNDLREHQRKLRHRFHYDTGWGWQGGYSIALMAWYKCNPEQLTPDIIKALVDLKQKRSTEDQRALLRGLQAQSPGDKAPGSVMWRKLLERYPHARAERQRILNEGRALIRKQKAD